MQNFVVIDTETGGVDPAIHSLLSVALVHWKPKKPPKEIINLFVNEGENIYMTLPAFNVNKIKKSYVRKHGLEPKDAVLAIRGALNNTFGINREPVILCGHNVAFDIDFMKRLYKMAGEDLNLDFEHRRTYDTASILYFLMSTELIPFERPKLDLLLNKCGIDCSIHSRHSALGDALATAEAFNALIDIYGQFKVGY